MSQKKKKTQTYTAARKKGSSAASAKKGSRTYAAAKKGKSSNTRKNAAAKAQTSAASKKTQNSAAKKQSAGRSSAKKISTGKIVRNIIIVAVVAAAAVLAGLYLKKAFYYKEHFFSGTVINGTDCSLMTADEAEETIQKTLNDYTYTFTDHEGVSSTITAPELSVTYVDDGEVDKLMEEQEYLLWILRQDDSETYNVTSGYTYDKTALDNWIAGLPCITDGVAPTDAYEVEKEDGYWEIIPETYGDMVDSELVRLHIEAAADEGKASSDISEINCFIQPSVLSDDPELVADVESKNAEVARRYRIEEITDVELLFSSYVDKVYLNKDILKEMIVDDEDGQPVISKEKIIDWVNAWAEERGFEYETNLFVTHGGKLMNVGNGIYGGWSMDVEATAERTYEAVVNRESGVLFPVTVDDYGNLQSESTYVEINILKQTMWYYIDGEQIVETPVVTGDCTKGMDTPSDGVWAIYMKMTDYTMYGPRYSDGSYEYVTFVNYWMPFNGQMGIHDMQSRDAFGGDIYKGNGSHGCVNTPFENAQKIFENSTIGTLVVVHS